MKPPSRRLRIAAMLLVTPLLALALVAVPQWLILRSQARELADQHIQYQVAHPGWSFPGLIWSDSVPLSQPRKRVLAAAKARDYKEKCPAKLPGEICAKTGDVVLRGGHFPEGDQPPGNVGWTRPLALEPVLIGTLIGPDSEVRWHLPLASAPAYLVDALVLSEDESFYEHHGVDFRGLARAVHANLSGGSYKQGASTLTMQVARNLSGQKEKTLERKAREALLALALDEYLGKQGVLQVYLDAPYLGQFGSYSICGFEAAARYYWGKSAHDLSLAQAATLASILPAPGEYAPDKNPKNATARRNALLERMAEKKGYDITAALAEPMDATPHPLPENLYPAYTQATRQWLQGVLAPETLYGAGLDVFTALDLVAQRAGDKVFPENLKWYGSILGHTKKNPLQGAGAIIEPQSGLLVAVYDGLMERATDFSRVTQAYRQPGSAIKPLVYAMAFAQKGPDGKPKFTAAHAVSNTPHKFPGTNGWSPRNITGEYSSTSALAMALPWSQNVATASLLEEIGGPKPFIEFANSLGFNTTRWPAELGLALGAGEVSVMDLTRFVATVVRGGQLASGRPVIFAVDPAGNLRIAPISEGHQILSPEAAALSRDLMRLVIEFGTAGRARGTGGKAGYPGPAIGKTGTNENEWDLWFTGATATYAATVWMGFDEPARVGGTAADLAAPMWGWWMRAVHEGLDMTKEFGGMKLDHKVVCTVTGKAGNGTCRGVSAPFLPGTGPEKGGCPLKHEPKPTECAEGAEGGEGCEVEATKKYKSLWTRLEEKKKAEDEAAAAGTIEGDADNVPLSVPAEPLPGSGDATEDTATPKAPAKVPADPATPPKKKKAKADR